MCAKLNKILKLVVQNFTIQIMSWYLALPDLYKM